MRPMQVRQRKSYSRSTALPDKPLANADAAAGPPAMVFSTLFFAIRMMKGKGS